MNKFHWRWSQAIFTAALLVLAVTAWIAFAPMQVGGLASYVIIRGTSMEPGFHYGDLVIVHRATEYRVGDIAAYQNQDIMGNVFHRIVGVNLDRYVFQGDNNSWLDSYQPTKEEIIGKAWIHLPKVGNALTWIRVPLNMAFTVGTLGGVMMAGSILDKPRSKAKKKGEKRTGGIGQGPVEGFIIGLGFLFLASIALGIYSSAHSVWREADPIPYEHKGTFTYSAAAEPGIYDEETIQTGEPIFPALTCTLEVQYTYTFSGEPIEELSGTYHITARIMEEQSNWKRTIPLEAETDFSGNSHTASTTVNLCQVESMVEAMETTTDFHPSSYTLAIIPSTTISGTFNGGAFEDVFEPRLILRFDAIHFYLDDSNPDIDPLNPSQAGLLENPSPAENRVSLLGMEFRVFILRVVAIIGFVLSVLGIAALVIIMYKAARTDSQAFVKMKYGNMLVNVSGKDGGTFAHPIDVDNIDELAKIAERNNTMMHHDAKNRCYYVNYEGKTYRCAEPEGKFIPKDESPSAKTSLKKDAK